MEPKAVRRPLIWIAAALICALIALALWATWAFLIAQSRTATIIDVSGTVLYHNTEGSDWVTASPGMQIRAGDQLFTQAPEGVVRVVSDDGNIGFQLEPDTLVTFTARWNAILKAGSGGLYMDHGTLEAETRHDLPDSKTHFVIETEAAKATVVGSRLVVQALRGMPATRVSSLEGEIHVEAISNNASIVSTDLRPFLEKEMVLNTAETVIVYINRLGAVSDEFNHNRGRVLDSQTHKGVEGVVVQVAGAPEQFAITDEDGYFAIPGDSIDNELVIAGTTREVNGDLELQPYVSRLTERVVDGTTGEGIPEAVITPFEYPHLAAVTGPNGAFTIEGLPVGAHTLSVVADGYLSQLVEATISRDGKASIDQIHIFTIGVYDDLNFLPLIMKNFFQYP
jgi:hypothetical protein